MNGLPLTYSWLPYLEPEPSLLPPPFFPEPLSPPEYLFHYTNELGKNSILEHQIIRKSFPAHIGSSANFGEGVYLTSIPPDVPNHVLLFNNWNSNGLVPDNFLNGSKMAKLQYCFAIPSHSLSRYALEKMPERNGRDIWLYRRWITLGDRNVLIKRRW